MPFRCAFLVQLYWWNLSIFLQVDAVHWLFVVVNFGFCAVWISERSLILFLKLSLFLVIFVLYNWTLSDSGAHTVQLKCLLWKKTRLRSWVCWLKWSKLPETTCSLLTLPGRGSWKMTFPWEFFCSSELHKCMPQRQVESYMLYLRAQRGDSCPPPLRRSPTAASVISCLN